MLDAGGNPAGGVPVVFQVNAVNGQQLLFYPYNSGVVTSAVGASGLATAPNLLANGTVGSYNVTASVNGLPSLTFTLTNTAGAAANLVFTSGSDQTAPVNSPFSLPLQLTVTDAGGNPAAGANFTFTAPNSGASAAFGDINGPNVFSLNADANGVVTTPPLYANGQEGGYDYGSGFQRRPQHHFYPYQHQDGR